MMMLLAWLGCSGGYSLEATIVDGLSGEPLGGYTVVARANDKSITLSCQTLEGEVGDDGTLVLPGLCAGTTYTIEPKGNVALPDLHEVPDGGFGGPKEVKGYRAPGGDGVYSLVDGELQSISTNAGANKDVPLGATEPVYYPSTTPGKFPVIEPGQWLVLAGESTELGMVPLVVNPERLEVENSQALQPWFYVGVSFEGNVPTPVPAKVDAAKVVEVTIGGRTLRYLPGDGVPAGRYVLFTPGDRRMILLDLGGKADLKLPSPEDADGGKEKGKGKGKKRR